MKYHFHKLELVYPPISNQEAEWVKDIKEVQEAISYSNLYMIGQKPESFFIFDETDIKKIIKKGSIVFQFKTYDKQTEAGIDIIKILKMNKKKIEDIDKIEIELGPKMIRFWFHEENEPDLLAWFTTEKFLWDKSRNHPAIWGMNDLENYFKYHLHYIGISKVEDSLSRLVIKPHDKRLRVLSNEKPKLPGSRPTDEIVLFFFRINTFRIHEYSYEDIYKGLQESSNQFQDHITIISDAEKAFIKLLNTEYNIIKYKDYPVSKDGLFNTDVNRYGYFLGESITFYTNDNYFRGSFTKDEIPMDNNADFLLIDKETKSVELFRYDEISV